MPTITREQIIRRQSQAPDGWTYDYKHFVIWGDNQLIRNIDQEDGSVLRATVYFWKEGQKLYGIKLSVRRWVETSTPDVWSSSECGKYIRIGTEPFTRKNYKDLCKHAARVTDELITLTYEGVNLQNAM